MFIAFDGMDGVGKNTQIQNIVDYYKKKGIQFETIDFGGERYFSKYLQHLNRGELTVPPELRELIYYFEGLYVNLNTIIPNKERKHFIIDRYYLSYIVYGQLNGMPKEEIQFFTKNLVEPDLYFFLDAPPEKTYKRIVQYRDIEPAEIGYRNFSSQMNNFSGADKHTSFIQFQQKVRNLYKSELKPNHIVISSDQSKEMVAQEIIRAIEKSKLLE